MLPNPQAHRPILLLTRPEPQSRRFASEVRERVDALDVLVAPVLDIRQIAFRAPAEAPAGLIFTSENGVEAFSAQSDLRALPVWCVGARTADAARARGFDDVTSAADDGGDAEGLLRLLLRQRPEGRLLHLRGAHARGDLAPRLTAAGIPCDATVVYDQVALPLSDTALRCLRGQRPVILPLFSPRTALLCARNAETSTTALWPVAISAAAAKAWQDIRPEEPVIAARPDSAAMLDALAGLVLTGAGATSGCVNRDLRL